MGDTTYIFCFQSEKGGVGKTTLSIHFAYALSWFGFPVILIDTDPQGSSRDWAAARADACPFAVVGYDRPTLHKDIERIIEGKAFAVIDSPPRITDIARPALLVSDAVIIPIQPSPLDLWATSDTLKLAEEAKGFNQKLKIGIAINREIGNTEISKAVEKELHKTGIKVFHNHIKQRVAFAEVMAEGKTVMEIKDSHDKANAEFGQLLVEILLWAGVVKSYQGRSYPRARKLRERFLQSADLDSIIKEYKEAGNDQWQLIMWVKRWLNS